MASGDRPQTKTRSAAEMFPLIQRWERSGLRQKEFCIQQGIKPSVFWYWLRRYREEGQPAAEGAPGFVSIEMDAPAIESALVEVIYPDGTRLVFKERVGLAFLQGLLPKV